jgi:hypothetical protein
MSNYGIKSRAKRRPAPKVKICWQRLGLDGPGKEHDVPIEEIRKQVSIVASQSLGRGKKS